MDFLSLGPLQMSPEQSLSTSYSKTNWRPLGKMLPSCLSGLVSRGAGVLFVVPSVGNWMLWALYVWTWVVVGLISQEGVVFVRRQPC